MQSPMMPNVKEKRNINKIGSTNAINLRILSLSGILVYNFKYAIVFKKQQRKADKILSYFPIESIKSPEGKEIFNDKWIHLTGRDKTIYCRAHVHELLRKLLQANHYDFEVTTTRKAGEETGNDYKSITIHKIVNFSYKHNNKPYYYKMDTVNDKLGLEIHEKLNSKLNSNLNIKNVILQNHAFAQSYNDSNNIDAIVTLLPFPNIDFIEMNCCLGGYKQ